MNIDTFLILIIFFILFVFIYYTFYKKNTINNKILVKEPFYNNQIKINTDINKYNIKNEGFVNELIPVKEELDYINPRIKT